jgi:hypothetical protein
MSLVTHDPLLVSPIDLKLVLLGLLPGLSVSSHLVGLPTPVDGLHYLRPNTSPATVVLSENPSPVSVVLSNTSPVTVVLSKPLTSSGCFSVNLLASDDCP